MPRTGAKPAYLRHSTAAASAPQQFDWNEHQLPIPRLPLPPLAETLDRYVAAVAPMCTAEELASTKSAVAQFAANEGAMLQQLLEERDRAGAHQRKLGEGTSYVRPFWNSMYLGGRYPVVINSNPVLMLKDLPQKQQLGQVGVAAAISAAAVRWCVGQRNGWVEPDFADGKKTVHTCMEEYAYLFGETRIPRPGADDLVINDKATHIAVIRGAQIYTIAVTDGSASVITDDALAAAFEKVIADDAAAPGSAAEFIGPLSSQERDWWAAERVELESNPANAKALHAIDSALFLVALDSTDAGEHLGEQLGWGVHGAGMMRWWDKNFTLQFDSRGTMGINFEHAPYDGSTVQRMIDDAWHEAAGLPLPAGRPSPSQHLAADATVPAAEKLSFELSERSKAAIAHATAKFEAFVDITKFVGVDFTHFGKAAIKQWKMSPDGVIQMAYQLAYNRLHSHDYPMSVYESCSTKRFLRGRTEAIRSTTLESVAFVQQADTLMQKGAAGMAEARELLAAAAGQHRNVAQAASQGKGVDRHLFSLLSLAGEIGRGADAAIFADPTWTKFNTSVLSTSNVNGGSMLVLAFGAVCPQGYGLGYTVEDDAIRVAVSNYIGDPDTGGSGFGGVSTEVVDDPNSVKTNAAAMAAAIEQALLDIEKIASASPQQAKL